MRRALLGLFVWALLQASTAKMSWAAGGTDCGTCNATAPTCENKVTYGTDDCGACMLSLQNNQCIVPQSADCGQPRNGATKQCNEPCSLSAIKCPTTWVPYGFAVPGDPIYGFPQVCEGGKPVFTDPTYFNRNDYYDYRNQVLVGFAAKGNIIIGDYTSDRFKDKVLGKLNEVKREYVVDPTDAALGYNDRGYNGKNQPIFSGNYDQVDMLGTGTKLDGTPRKFYESSLSDTDFKALVDPAYQGQHNPDDDNNTHLIQGVLFTNHAFAGLMLQKRFRIDGSVVARDDAFIYNDQLSVFHDIRLLRSQPLASLPVTLARPKLCRWQECSPSGCPDLPAQPCP